MQNTTQPPSPGEARAEALGYLCGVGFVLVVVVVAVALGIYAVLPKRNPPQDSNPSQRKRD